MSLTASDLARLGPAAQKQVVEKVLAQKTGKYHNRKTVRHGITFDSKHEADRYDELRLLLKAGTIHDLKLQQTYKLVGGAENAHRSRCEGSYIHSRLRVYPRRENDCRGRKGL